MKKQLKPEIIILGLPTSLRGYVETLRFRIMISLLLATGLINLRMDITLDIIIQGQSQACIIFKKVRKITKNHQL